MVKRLVSEADTSAFNDPSYDMKLMKAVKVFMHHAEEEENDQLSKVKSMLSPEESDVSVDLLGHIFDNLIILIESSPRLPESAQDGPDSRVSHGSSVWRDGSDGGRRPGYDDGQGNGHDAGTPIC